MPRITINKQPIDISEGASVLDASRKVGVFIPTMCHLEGYKHFTSCMVCLVEDKNTKKLIPSCSAPAVDGMKIETDNERVREARTAALELLLSEHIGDCTAPCQRACPAGLNIPLMLRQFQDGDNQSAYITARQGSIFPGLMGIICEAPCEKVCRRKEYDGTLKIRLLESAASTIEDNAAKNISSSGKHIAVIGAGPAGLAAVYVLRELGHDCTLFEKEDLTGGRLREACAAVNIDNALVEEELGRVVNGVTLKIKTTVDRKLLKDLSKKNDAVLITVGSASLDLAITIKEGYQTDNPNVFIAGDGRKPFKMLISSIGDGKKAAMEMDRFLNKDESAKLRSFQSYLGHLQENEIEEFLKDAAPASSSEIDINKSEDIKQEAARCLHCDCRKADNCRLREYSSEYKAHQQRYKGLDRKSFTRDIYEDRFVFEKGKCIKCGICVRISEKAEVKFGYTFLQRGFDLEVGVPFHDEPDAHFTQVMGECIKSCPTRSHGLER